MTSTLNNDGAGCPAPPPREPARLEQAAGGPIGVIVTTWFVMAILITFAVGTALNATDIALWRRVLGATLDVISGLGFLVLQARLLRGRATPKLHWAATMIIALTSLVIVNLSYSWRLQGVALVIVCLLRPTRSGYLIAAALWAGSSANAMLYASTPQDAFLIPVVNLLVLFVLLTLTQVALLLRDLRTSREEIARLQVDSERSRISRDLHDILGRTLVAASLRNQTALRLIDSGSDLARTQLEAAQDVLASGQAQLRALTAGPIIADLVEEVEGSRAMFARLGIRFTVDADAFVDLTGEYADLTARLIREASTNVLKHSIATSCTVDVKHTPLRINVTNDGAALEAPVVRGTGLRHLRDRVASAGGTLTDKFDGRGRYTVTLIFPDSQEPV